MWRHWENERLRLLNFSVSLFVKSVNSFSRKYHSNYISSFFFIIYFENFGIQLLHYWFYFHHDKFEHRIRVNIFILSKENSYPCQSLWYTDKIMSMNFISIKGKKYVWNASVSSHKLENCKENLLEIKIKIRFQVTESDWGLEHHTFKIFNIWHIFYLNVSIQVSNNANEIIL